MVGATLCGGLAWKWRRPTAEDPTADLEVFVELLSKEITAYGPDYFVRGLVPGTFTMVIGVKGQEVPVPLDNIHRHFVTFPDQLALVTSQLLSEIEDVGLEAPEDHKFVDAAVRILPQICRTAWVYENGPAFGDSAIVNRDLGNDLSICYVIDDPSSVIFVCQAHLKFWARTEEDIFHLANQNLRRMSGEDLPMPSASGGPVRVDEGDGYDAARLLLLDARQSEGLLIAIPERDSLYLGLEKDRQSMRAMVAEGEPSEYPVSPDLYRIDGQKLSPVSTPDLE
jgi:hypothetical protein